MGGNMADVLQMFYCAGFDERRLPFPLRMIEDLTQRQYARDAYREGRKDYKRQEMYLRAIGRIH